MKTIKRIFLLAFSALIFGNVHTINAQVTIGGETAPVKGATLDLSPSGGYVGGLKLPNVSLNSLTAIPTSFTEGTSATASGLIGTVVYNTNASVGGKGMYMWDGAKWQFMFSGASSLLNTIYPIGSIYMSVSPTNPGSLFGGTWVAWGAGRVPVSVASSGTFNTVEKTGGAETHTLTVAEMPSHTHELAALDGSLGTLSGYTPNVLSTVVSNKSGYSISYKGGSQAHNNLQPYITCYMWKRTN